MYRSYVFTRIKIYKYPQMPANKFEKNSTVSIISATRSWLASPFYIRKGMKMVQTLYKKKRTA